MSDTTSSPTLAEAAAAADAALAEAAAEALAQRVADLAAAHLVVATKLDALKAQLAVSLAKAGADPGHIELSAAFVRDVGLKTDEIAAWIARNP